MWTQRISQECSFGTQISNEIAKSRIFTTNDRPHNDPDKKDKRSCADTNQYPYITHAIEFPNAVSQYESPG